MAERRWVTEGIDSRTLELLASGLSGTALQSLLLEVMQRRAERKKPAELLAQYRRDPFCEPASVDLRTSLALDQALLAALPQFEAIELSPVAPLGACSAIAPTHQHRVLSALRACEVVSDPTNVLALECAKRLRTAPDRPVQLATSLRVVRAQPVPKLAGFTQHFRIFALASAGREAQAHAFTLRTLVSHIRGMLDALDQLRPHGYEFLARRVVILSTAGRETLARAVGAEFPDIDVEYQPLDHVYYSGGLRYQIWLTPAASAETLPVIDGGAFDWLAKLTSNRRAVFVASGAGTQLLARRFRRPDRG